ncbi:MAG: DNA translocase FtsK 4TM domain-containing protein [Bacteroidales bacterium]|nr:DNA translocase FtsK 4TM domain-containing protein [Bacteroidales bacterium]
MSRFTDYLAFWRNWDDAERNTAKVILGFAVAVLCVFLLISGVSYLFHWQQDMSLLGDPSMMDRATQASNAGSKLGYRTGHLLIGQLFGLGSFALLVILVAISARLIAQKWNYSMLRTLLIALSGAVVASLLLAFCGNLAGIPYAFGGGLGGNFGAQLILWCSNLVGTVVTGLLVLLLVACWLFFCSHRFSEWVASLRAGRKTGDFTDGVAAAEGNPFEPVRDYVAHPSQPAGWAPPSDVAEGGTPPEENALHGSAATDDEAGQARSEKKTAPEEVEATGASEGNEGVERIDDDTLEQPYEELPPFDNRMDPPEGLPKFKAPSIDLLLDHAEGRRQVSTDELQRNNNKIRATLRNYRIEVTEVKAQVGPTVTLYRVSLAPGVRIAEVKKLQEDIAMSMNAKGVRVVALSDSVGIEVANDFASTVPVKSLLNSEAFRTSKYELPVAIGYTITQQVKVFDLSDAPHLLVAGATKQGKSVGLNVIISSLLYAKHPSELKFVFIDPKMVEFSAYNRLLKHYLAVMPTAGDEEEEQAKAIVKSAKDAEITLKSLCVEMDERYTLLNKAGVNKITVYNEKYKARKLNPKNGHRFLPYLVVVVDEYADLTMTMGASPEVRAASKSITNSIIRLAQKGRAAGLHVILATQRPSVDVISGVIKGNFPLRIAFRVASRVDSMTILDSPGAEKLIGRGDMLLSAGIDNERIQCGYIDGKEIDAVTEFIGDQQGYGKSYNTPYYLPEVKEEKEEGAKGEVGDLDERFEEAARLVVTTQKGSTSDLQRRLGMGYAKAGRVMDQLEQAGVVGPQEGSKPRTVLVQSLDELETLIDNLRNA